MLLSSAAFPIVDIRGLMPVAVGTIGVREVKEPMGESPGLPMVRGVSMPMAGPDIMDRLDIAPIPWFGTQKNDN